LTWMKRKLPSIRSVFRRLSGHKAAGPMERSGHR